MKILFNLIQIMITPVIQLAGVFLRSVGSGVSNEKYSDIEYGIKLCAGNIGFNNNIYTFPYYCAFLLKKYLQ